MEAKSALVRSDGGAELDAEATVDVDVAFVVGPWNAEGQHPLWLNDALEQVLLCVLRLRFQNRLQRA
eukprot:2453045-Rhodomonas_salina.1